MVKVLTSRLKWFFVTVLIMGDCACVGGCQSPSPRYFRKLKIDSGLHLIPMDGYDGTPEGHSYINQSIITDLPNLDRTLHLDVFGRIPDNQSDSFGLYLHPGHFFVPVSEILGTQRNLDRLCLILVN